MDREYWQKVLWGAERDLEVATTRSGVIAAAKKLMRARLVERPVSQQDVGQDRQPQSSFQLGAGGPVPGHSLPDVGEPLLRLPLTGQGPTKGDRGMSHPEIGRELPRQFRCGSRVLECRFRITAELVKQRPVA